MEVHQAVKELMEVLSKVSRRKPFLGLFTSPGVEVGEVRIEGEMGQCDPFPSFAYLDSSSRVITVRGANVYMASLYVNTGRGHIAIPLETPVPFMAVKASDQVVQEIESSLPHLVRTRNVNGVPYLEDYKDDNVLDELRISLENYAINSQDLTVVDGPIYPGPFLGMVSEPYRSAFETLITQRRVDRLVGVVKRLNMSRKLSRLLGIEGTDDVVVMELGKGRDVYVTPVLREDYRLSDRTLPRYMAYVKVGDSPFRVESADPSLLCGGVVTALRHPSYRGIPSFIEAADRLSRRLSAATFLISFTYAREMVGVNYDDWNRLREANLDLAE
jgi:hypothetical protein